jgi:hypothetical protein
MAPRRPSIAPEPRPGFRGAGPCPAGAGRAVAQTPQDRHRAERLAVLGWLRCSNVVELPGEKVHKMQPGAFFAQCWGGWRA